MNIKRVLTALIGLPAVALVFIFGNKYIIDVIIAIVACMANYEYFKCCSKEGKNLSWIGYILAIGIAFLHMVNPAYIVIFLGIAVPTILLLLFLHIIISDMKITLKDIAFSFLGIMYIMSFIVFIPLIYGLEGNVSLFTIDGANDLEIIGGTGNVGKYLIWYLMWISWGSDIFAYCIGKHFGKHKFSHVSPNKTIEGCLAGVIGAVVLSLGYTYWLNTSVGFNINYLAIGIISLILCLVGQIGDFAASSIKRYFDVKDFSEIFPGHGGIIDRIDSVMFIAPYAFCLFAFFL